MRVLMTADAVGGVWQYATTLAHSLAERHGVQVLLAVFGPVAIAEAIAALEPGSWPGGGSVEIQALDLPLEWEGAAEERYEEARRALLELALQWRAHILHANEHYLGSIARSGLPVVVVSHSDLRSWQAAVYPEAPQAVDAAYLQRVRAGLQAASLVIAPSTYVADSLCRWYDYSGVVRVIPNGVRDHPGTLAPARTVDALMAGRLWDPAKNLDCFLKAAAGLPRGTFLAAGPLQAPGQQAQPWSSTRVQHVGVLPNNELRHLLARTRLAVSPARYDPFGLLPVEGALAGCCLVLGDISSYRAIWETAAVYFDPREPQALGECLRELLQDSERRHEMAARARERARLHYTAARMAAAYLASYQRLVLRRGLAL